ncbi:uncharacterized protein LOC141631214 [Silene latifolia]|uniref:uncharacterized protein LOC141631214 n=1 Tax=Silene latifolia TaxID=37657 RepID=UPI003D770868
MDSWSWSRVVQVGVVGECPSGDDIVGNRADVCGGSGGGSGDGGGGGDSGSGGGCGNGDGSSGYTKYHPRYIWYYNWIHLVPLIGGTRRQVRRVSSPTNVHVVPTTTFNTAGNDTPPDVLQRLVRDLCDTFGESYDDFNPSIPQTEQAPRSEEIHSSQLIDQALEGYWDIGDPNTSAKCGAQMWYQERKEKRRGTRCPKFSLCCSDGKVVLPRLKEPPQLLKCLLSKQHRLSNHFIENIRAYNVMFSFTSMGGKIDHSVNQGRGPYTLRMGGQNIHRIGSLLPSAGTMPKFCQLYIYDTEEEVENRKTALSQNTPNRFDDELIESLQKMVDEKNPVAKNFRMARDRLSSNEDVEVSIRLISRRDTDGRTYNCPTASEVATLIEGDLGPNMDKRDIIVQKSCGRLQRISELHPSYMAPQYPLLFPFGEDGYRLRILHGEESLGISQSENPRDKLTLREWFAFRIQDRPLSMEYPILLLARRLFQQFLVDGYTTVEAHRLLFVHFKQDLLRVENYNTLSRAVEQGDVEPSSAGCRLIVPPSFVGGGSYMRVNYLDTMTIYILCRVFKIKLDELMIDFKERHIFGRVRAAVYTIEFQKRGLPHAHILLFLHREDKFPEAADIDKIISAEIPDPVSNPVLHAIVATHMMHGPCGTARLQSPCMVGSKCSKFFPKKCIERTTVDKDGYPVYKRSKDGPTIVKDDVELGNGFVVPYNP